MKNLTKLINQKISNLEIIRGGDGEYKEGDIWTGPYEETGETDVAGNVKTRFVDPYGRPRTDIKIGPITIYINPN